MQTWLLQLIELLKRDITISRTLENLLEQLSFETVPSAAIELTETD